MLEFHTPVPFKPKVEDTHLTHLKQYKKESFDYELSVKQQTIIRRIVTDPSIPSELR